MGFAPGWLNDRRHVHRPSRSTLDYIASQRVGWDPEAGRKAPYCYGNISAPAQRYKYWLKLIIRDIKLSTQNAVLVNEIRNVGEVPLDTHVVRQPSQSPLVPIHPDLASRDGIIPVAAYFQSGWEHAQPYVFIRQDTYERLKTVAARLREINPRLSLAVMDGWRSNEQQQEIYDAFYPDGYTPGEPLYISQPTNDASRPAPHTTGATADVFLAFDGIPLELGTPYDFMDTEANTLHFENTRSDALTRNLRRLLSNVMAEQDFVPLDSEWWHFEHGTLRWAAKTGNEPLYSSAIVTQEMTLGVRPVDVAVNSRRAEIEFDHTPGR